MLLFHFNNFYLSYMEFRDLDYFVVLARHRHVGRAAEALGLSQPALSLSLRRLESSFQTKLVTRTPKGVELTAVGSALLSRAGRLRMARDEIEREIADLTQGRAGTLRIGVGPGTAEDLVADASSSLLRTAPEVSLHVTADTFNRLVPALRNGELDMVVASAEAMSHADFTTEPLYEDEFVAYVSHRHGLAKRKRLALADLANYRWAVPAKNAHVMQKLREPFEKLGLPLPQCAVESNSTAVRLRMVARGDLIGFSSRYFLRQVDPRFQLVELAVKEIRFLRRLGISYRKDAYLAPAARRLMAILESAAQQVAFT